ncbi:fasciclin-2 isoform X2 [Orussus abietinus]|uniref:fasciclin-2 isoform X2 n=1 Tax=Orussus abietinus TaxID=222816 RepID=UPI00062646DD|nr:fasciclin-2 isoform X2 [Orussus abietinus]
MAARRVAACFVLLHLAAGASAASLEILPSGDLQTKPIGVSIILTCKPSQDVADLNLITDMQWLDPQNRSIESQGAYGYSKPPMYTEMHQGTSLQLFFNSLQEEQAGRYTCRANYANTEALSKSVTIETIVAITWEDAPEEQFPILGEDYSIKCKVRAQPSPSVDWLFNGELIKTNEHYIIDTHALKIKNVQESDDGVYTCRASVTTTGELQERAIRVEVYTRPEIEELNSPVEMTEGESKGITCKAKGKPPPKFMWVKSVTQQDLSKADRFEVNEDTGTLFINNVKREDVGEYQCVASNGAGRATTNIQVYVVVKPKIMEFTNKTIAEGNTVELQCKAFGQPPPVISFRKHTMKDPYTEGIQKSDDRIILTNQADDMNSETVGTLTINNARRSDDGLYECIASNKGGPAHKNVHLAVEFPPSFASMPNNTVWSWEQRPVNLTCIAESIPNATIEWTMNGDQKIDNNPAFKKIGKGPISTLVVVPIDKRYYAHYKCTASNLHGTRSHMIELREANKPGELLQAKIVDITATTIAFNLVPPPTQEGLPIKTLTVQYKEQAHAWTNARNKTWAVGSPYILEGLQPQTYYDFRFKARNEVGFGNWGNYLKESTPRRTVPSEPIMTSKPPSGQEYDSVNYHNQYQLMWTIPPDNGEPIDLYQIRYCQMNHVADKWEVLENTCKTEDTKGQRSQHWLKYLDSDTFYMAEVRAHNALGYGPAGVTQFKTATGTDSMVMHHEGPLISSAAIIGIVIAILFIIIVIIDIICCCAHKTGIIYYVCERSRRKPMDEDDAKLGSLYGWRFPLPYCDQKMANVAGVTAIQDSGSGKSTIRLVKHTAM